MNVRLDGPGVKAVSDTSSPDRWVTRLVMPLAGLVQNGVAPGDKVYLNVIRVSSPQIAGAPKMGIDTWVPFCTVHEVDRLAEIQLEK